jgi:acyl carrier protein
MSAQEILAVIRDELARIAPEIEFAALDPGVDLREQADLDSMDYLNLLTALHQRLAVEIPDADAQKLATLDGAVAYVEAKRGGPASG